MVEWTVDNWDAKTAGPRAASKDDLKAVHWDAWTVEPTAASKGDWTADSKVWRTAEY
jgi:hypothetical protein